VTEHRETYRLLQFPSVSIYVCGPHPGPRRLAGAPRFRPARARNGRRPRQRHKSHPAGARPPPAGSGRSMIDCSVGASPTVTFLALRNPVSSKKTTRRNRSARPDRLPERDRPDWRNRSPLSSRPERKAGEAISMTVRTRRRIAAPAHGLDPGVAPLLADSSTKQMRSNWNVSQTSECSVEALVASPRHRLQPALRATACRCRVV
jgi:hypothetical protein